LLGVVSRQTIVHYGPV